MNSQDEPGMYGCSNTEDYVFWDLSAMLFMLQNYHFGMLEEIWLSPLRVARGSSLDPETKPETLERKLSNVN